ncbi:MAG TPA: sulfatase-like hydrolase/transferase [Oceanipulchritudo sp.]|nr:sulfatase-like hydrolase/transferase [Oceanipulchritudo sp.]
MNSITHHVLFPVLISMASLILSIPCFAGEKPADPPNFIIIIADDLGWADISIQQEAASRDVSTPNIDRLYREGIRFTNGYVASSTCGPSRSSLLTGRTSSRFAMEDNQPGSPLEGPPATEILLPAIISGKGYKSGAIGKWHLGEAPDRLPAARGFDEFFGFLGGSHDYYSGTLTRNTENVPLDGYITDVLADGAVEFIQKNKDNPFFLYVAFNAPHSPMQAPQRLIERVVRHQPRFADAFTLMKNKGGPDGLPFFDLRPFKGKNIDVDLMRLVYCAMVFGLDDGVGKILDAVDGVGIRENTIIVFLSDNGAALARPNDLGGVNLPLRSGKGSVFEGGVRVPFGISWRNTLPEGIEFHGTINAVDLFTTFVELAGATIPGDRVIDGVNIIPYLKGDIAGNPHESFFFRRKDRNMFSYRSGDYKLVVAPRQIMDPSGELYNLASDIGESVDLSVTLPEVKARLRQEYDEKTLDLPDPVVHTPGSN